MKEKHLSEILTKHHKYYFRKFEKQNYPTELYRTTERKYVKWALLQGANVTEMKDRIKYMRGKYETENRNRGANYKRD